MVLQCLKLCMQMNRIKVNLNGNPMMGEHFLSINANERIYLY